MVMIMTIHGETGWEWGGGRSSRLTNAYVTCTCTCTEGRNPCISNASQQAPLSPHVSADAPARMHIISARYQLAGWSEYGTLSHPQPIDHTVACCTTPPVADDRTTAVPGVE